MKYETIRLIFGALATVGLYSVLYRENKMYRFFEHVFLGLASGYTLVAVWTETLKQSWWDPMVGTQTENGVPGQPGFWAYMFLLPIGLMGYFVFSKKNNWLSRIPIGIILGLWSGQQLQVWWNRYGPQLDDSLRPIIPTSFNPMFVPSTKGLPKIEVDAIKAHVYVSTAVSNIIFVITLLSVLSYFLFSFELKAKFMQKTTLLGRWLLMIGFGAIFGSTVMMRFTLLIDRMYFIWVETVWQGILGQK